MAVKAAKNRIALLKGLRARLAKTTDRLGQPIDKGILETVLYLNAFGLSTEASCQGHGRGKKTKRDQHYRGPWVEIYPKEPQTKNWFKNAKLRNKVAAEGLKQQSRALELLAQFYRKHKVGYDTMLIISGIGYGFRVQSAGLETLNELPAATINRRAVLYKREMREFTKFLERYYKTSAT